MEHECSVPNGDGSTVSMSRDATFEPKRPSVMLLAGDVMGDYELVVTIQATGQVVGSDCDIAWAYGGFTASGSAGNVTVNARGVVMSSTWGDGSTLDQGG